ncbi:F-box/LRR-repeat protein 17-like [Tachysurus ichikawai]
MLGCLVAVTDRSVQAFAEHCPELQFVGFMGCSVTSQGVIHLTRRLNPEWKISLLSTRGTCFIQQITVQNPSSSLPTISSY